MPYHTMGFAIDGWREVQHRGQADDAAGSMKTRATVGDPLGAITLGDSTRYCPTPATIRVRRRRMPR